MALSPWVLMQGYLAACFSPDQDKYTYLPGFDKRLLCPDSRGGFKKQVSFAAAKTDGYPAKHLSFLIFSANFPCDGIWKVDLRY